MKQPHRDDACFGWLLQEIFGRSSLVKPLGRHCESGTTNVTVAAPVFLYDMWDNRVNPWASVTQIGVFASFLIPTERINQPQLHFSHNLKEFNLQGIQSPIFSHLTKINTPIHPCHHGRSSFASPPPLLNPIPPTVWG